MRFFADLWHGKWKIDRDLQYRHPDVVETIWIDVTRSMIADILVSDVSWDCHGNG